MDANVAERLSAGKYDEATLYGEAGTAWLGVERSKALGLSYPQYLERCSTGANNKVALVYRERSYSYQELFSTIHSTAENLRASYGIRHGDRVVINMENSDRYVLVYLAVLRAGGIAVPINPKFTAREIEFVLSDARPVLYCCDQAGYGLAATAAASIGIRTKIGLAEEACVLSPSRQPLPKVAPADAGAIFYTSGTTGNPKGVIHTHETLIAGALQSARAWSYDKEGWTTLATTPLFHIAAHAWFLPVLANKGTLVVDTFKTERIFELIERYKIDALGAVPSMLLMMTRFEGRHQYDLRSVKNVRFGASPMPPDKLRTVQDLFPNAALLHGMGQTESGGTISVLPGHLAFEKAGGTGFPLPGCAVRVVDEEGRTVPDGTAGEILARGPNVMVGYFNRPEETAKTLAGGWLHTGDIGYVDADGCIYLVDRKKDMIIRGGENIYSVEIENVLMTHPAIVACAVIGVPDDLLGELVCAVVVTAEGAGRELEPALLALCRQQLAHFKVPAIFEFVTDLPRTATGKTQKGILRQELLARRAAPAAQIV